MDDFLAKTSCNEGTESSDKENHHVRCALAFDETPTDVPEPSSPASLESSPAKTCTAHKNGNKSQTVQGADAASTPTDPFSSTCLAPSLKRFERVEQVRRMKELRNIVQENLHMVEASGPPTLLHACMRYVHLQRHRLSQADCDYFDAIELSLLLPH
eukprot:TRINITY_DN7457_c0_g1_i1.p4 TRINITY_DN7457_c0_g1~~TRINITY_DN7457_c0_g1_i1.p4  ORF type:complete len:157 (-),score=55.41 TRINITY_DN7457_c0_g1_i1:60-530(-)